MNPNSQVPTLEEEDGFTLWESNVILRYLAGVHGGGAPIWPGDAKARADIDRWMDWQHTVLGAPVTAVFQGLVRTPPHQRDRVAIAAAADRLGQVFGVAGPATRRAGLRHGRGVHPRRHGQWGVRASLVHLGLGSAGHAASPRLV